MAEMYMQETMPSNIVPLSKGQKAYESFAEWLSDPDADEQKKRDWIWEVKDFATLNSITKKDLQAALRFMAEDCYKVEKVQRLGIVKESEQDDVSEDITFCDDSDTCKRKTCFRHKCHIKHFEIPHSYAHLKGTKLCESKEGDSGGKCEEV